MNPSCLASELSGTCIKIDVISKELQPRIVLSGSEGRTNKYSPESKYLFVLPSELYFQVLREEQTNICFQENIPCHLDSSLYPVQPSEIRNDHCLFKMGSVFLSEIFLGR